MRIIVALALVSFLEGQPQRADAIARNEAAVAQHPDSLAQRGALLRMYRF